MKIANQQNRSHTSDYSAPIVELIDRSLTLCTCIDDLKDCCEALTLAVDAEHYCYQNYLPIANQINAVTNMDIEWIKRYIARGYSDIDPVVLHCAQHSTPLKWCDVNYADENIEQKQKAMMLDKERHGMGSGISFPVHGPGSELSMLCLSAATGKLPEYGVLDTALLSLFASCVHNKYREIENLDTSDDQYRKRLGTREREAMRWAVAGKTSWEISKIMQCSEATIVFLIRTVIEKLEANNRIQAASKIISEAHIMPFGELKHPAMSNSGSSYKISCKFKNIDASKH